MCPVKYGQGDGEQEDTIREDKDRWDARKQTQETRAMPQWIQTTGKEEVNYKMSSHLPIIIIIIIITCVHHLLHHLLHCIHHFCFIQF